MPIFKCCPSSSVAQRRVLPIVKYKEDMRVYLSIEIDKNTRRAAIATTIAATIAATVAATLEATITTASTTTNCGTNKMHNTTRPLTEILDTDADAAVA